ncbi:hypothetical protein [Corynebacterium kalidii]
MAHTTPAPRADISSIQTLLANDVARLRTAEEAIVALKQRLDSWTDDEGIDPMQLRREFDEQCAHAAEARQSFSARTEILQHIDLEGVTVEEFIAQALKIPAGGTGDEVAAGGADPDPDSTRALMTAHATPQGSGAHAASPDQARATSSYRITGRPETNTEGDNQHE